MWGYISRVINTPIELIENSYYDFMEYTTIERDIIIKFCDLNDDYKEISQKLASVTIDDSESDFNHRMKELYFEILKIGVSLFIKFAKILKFSNAHCKI